MVEYIWVGGTGLDIRSKTRVLEGPLINDIAHIPEWNYDGSSTYQADGSDSEIWLRPVKMYPDPFRLGNNLLVLCDTYRPDERPANTNFRAISKSLFEKSKNERPWFGMEQEYVLYRVDTYPHWPLGFPFGGYPESQGPYYCSNGATSAFGRQIMEAHMRCCLYSGIKISGTNAEVMPGQWEYQVGPVEGLDAADQLWISRYILLRVAEHFGVGVNFESKPIQGWNGSGMHVNFSTESTRNEGGMDVIRTYLERLGNKHKEMIEVSGEGNEKRLSGKYETSSNDVFSWGVANRGASIRIPRLTEKEGKGYLEDRRPAANCDPYVVCAMLADITINSGENIEGLHQ